MPLDFPSSPTNGQTYIGPGGVTWVWDGTKWAVQGPSGTYLPLTGGTLSGPLILNADPTANLGAAEEVAKVLPELCGTATAKLKGKDTELQTVAPTGVVFALCNAIRELKAEIDNLKTQLSKKA